MKPQKKSVTNYPVPSRTIPLDIGTIHFVGIGGIGMSGIAEILCNMGYSISGSDMADNANVERLRAMGVSIQVGHKAENIATASVVVKSTAVPKNNVELVEALERGVPVVSRSEMLAELTRLKATIAVAGTHGKTTTTSMVSAMLDSADLDPTIINGGIINTMGTNARLGTGDWLVVEADESDGTFIKIPSTIGVVTNIEPEHLDYYGSFQAVKDAFAQFIERLPFYGVAVLCCDHEEVNKLAATIKNRRVVSYGMHKDADFRAVNVSHEIDGARFDVEVSSVISEEKTWLKDVYLPMPGQHNVQNSLAAIAIGKVLDIPVKKIMTAFENFAGVKRRFTIVGKVNGITVIDDYAHHPTEIAATLDTAKKVVQSAKGKVIAVVQPHRYSRLKHLFEEFSTCFAHADRVVVMDVYEAGESPIDGASKVALTEAIKVTGTAAIALEADENLAVTIEQIAEEGDVVVCMGAGSISKMANALPDEIKAL